MIVVLGATGFIGQAFARHLKANDNRYLAVSRRDVDYYDPDVLSGLLKDVRADFLINAAGYTGRPNVDACEKNKGECIYANSVLPARVLQACERTQVPWGHVSSGCIFSGTRPDGAGLLETDVPNFTFHGPRCSYYSGTKALGEEVLTECEKCYIWRIRMPFNHVDHPRNYLSKLLAYERLLEARNSLSHLDECVLACLDCWKLRVPFGIYHLTNGGSIQTTEVVAALQRTIARDRHFRFFENEEEFMKRAANAPRSHCVLDNSKALAAGLHLSDVHDAIQSTLLHWEERSAGES